MKTKKTPPTPAQKDYDKLFSLSRHIRILQGIVSHLDWDLETYMPQGAAPIRAEQIQTMAGIIHREKTGKKFTRALSKLIDIKNGNLLAQELKEEQKAALREWQRDYLQDTALPASFVEKFAKTTSQAVVAWRLARENNDFAQFAPHLTKIVELSRKKADLIGYKNHPYDALLDQYEPGMTTAEISSLFTILRQKIIPIIQKATQKNIDNSFLSGSFAPEKQMEFGQLILKSMGYDTHYGRLDLSTHPFSSASHPTDSRITTRIHASSLMSHILVVLHEAGHALYEMGLPQEQYGSPLGEARSLGIHESQSRWWETRIGLSKPFWSHFYPLLQQFFKESLKHVSLENFILAINKVEPSFIRVEADELTYPLHVILRFELEKGLIEGSLRVEDVPEMWNAKMKEYLNITPQSPRDGCLQDIHWAMGGIGYFPTYTLGNLYAAALFETFEQEISDWKERVALGELKFIRDWLHNKIYKHGKRYPTKELLKMATGKEFSEAPYLNYLLKKYTQIA